MMFLKAPAYMYEETLQKRCFPKCFLGLQTRKHLLRKQTFLNTNRETLILLLQQRFRNIASSFAGVLGPTPTSHPPCPSHPPLPVPPSYHLLYLLGVRVA